MKLKILTIILLLLEVGFSKAQNIQLHYNNQLLTNNERLLIIGDTSLSDMVFEVSVTNNTANTMDISCQRYTLDSITASDLYMCWQNCTVLDFGGTLSLEPGETTTVFGAHCNPNGHFGVERDLYTFYDANNPSDSSSFQALFSTTSFLIEDENQEAMVMESKEFWTTNGDAISYHIPFIANIADRDQNIVVQQEIISLADEASIGFEWGGTMYEDMELSDAVLINAQDDNDTFISYYQAGNNLGISHIRYHFFLSSALGHPN